MGKYINTDNIKYSYLPLAVMPAFFVTKEQIQNMQGEDVAPVRHARWMKLGYSYFCAGKDGCGFSVSGNLWPDVGYYCPKCGAKMDEKEEK